MGEAPKSMPGSVTYLLPLPPTRYFFIKSAQWRVGLLPLLPLQFDLARQSRQSIPAMSVMFAVHIVEERIYLALTIVGLQLHVCVEQPVRFH